ncbi:MAG TPA: hypothetical protein VH108_02065 [Gaiellaceae bacterium]|nr:hypothetical protein [Gaiellaceae bacterium]
MKLVVALCSVALIWSAAASGASHQLLAPNGLHAFVLRADEPVKADHTYTLMPAFAWNATPGASHYDLQLATSSVFSDATMLYSQSYGTPVASIQKQVPWMTGKPYALWVRVRSVGQGRTSSWSTPFGFNTAWQEVPHQLSAPTGLIRWSPVQGATGYEVWYLNVPGNFQDHFSTLTNVADEREYWTFHPSSASVIRWRVRAVRLVQSGSLPNGIPVVTYGPYSPIFVTNNKTTIINGTIKPVEAISNVESPPTSASPHQLTPGFAWSGTTDLLGDDAGGVLWRVYVFSDKQCINPVMTGSLTGSPAWAPRSIDPLKMPGTVKDLADAAAGKFPGFGAQAGVFTADGTTPSPAESGGTASSAGATTTPSTSPNASSSTVATPRQVSLPDNGWPQGRYWWTVVPVGVVDVVADPTKGASSGDALEYHDLALPQDLCAANGGAAVWPFGVQSAPVTTTSGTPYASGLISGTRVVSAAKSNPSFRELPVVTWEPALAANTYDIELSRHLYPWHAVRKQVSAVTSAVLPLRKTDLGVWYYRVRGVNPNLSGPAQKLAWSTPTEVRISGDRFVIVK